MTVTRWRRVIIAITFDKLIYSETSELTKTRLTRFTKYSYLNIQKFEKYVNLSIKKFAKVVKTLTNLKNRKFVNLFILKIHKSGNLEIRKFVNPEILKFVNSENS